MNKYHCKIRRQNAILDYDYYVRQFARVGIILKNTFLFRGRSHLLRHGLVRFLAAGAVNSLFGYGLFALLYYLGIHYALALLIATVIGVLFNFKTTGYLVFRSNDNSLIFRFAASYAVVYAVNVSCLKILSLIGIDMYYGGAVLILPMAVLAYIINKKFVFKNG